VRRFQGQERARAQLQSRLEVHPGLLVSSSGSDPALGEHGDRARPVVLGVGGELGELIEGLVCCGQVAASELHLDAQAEQRRAV
jgi:hypothetical protein